MGPEEALGEEIRAKITRGWLVWYRLSYLASTATSQHKPRRKKSMLSFKLPFTTKVKTSGTVVRNPIHARWHAYMDSLSTDDVVNIALAAHCLWAKVKSDGLELVKEGRAPLWSYIKVDEEFTALTMLVDLLDRKGPSFIDALWSQDSSRAKQAEVYTIIEVSQLSTRDTCESPAQWARNYAFERPIEPAIPGCENASAEANCYHMSTFYNYHMLPFNLRKTPITSDLPRALALQLRHDEYVAAYGYIGTSCWWEYPERGTWQKKYQPLKNPSLTLIQTSPLVQSEALSKHGQHS
ncbi:MAG: hypothetical protein Q9220_002433 [cf. Caloplaca sp. 1 TL-2023]